MTENHKETRTYLAVPYSENGEAKQLGAKWDPVNKKWYAPNKESILIGRWGLKQLHLSGEDRTYGGNKLFVDLIPETCWFTNVRYCVHPSDWEQLRIHIFERVNYICECCGVDAKKTTTRLEAHERWDYDEKTQTQKLVRLVALCHECHQSTHIGYARIIGKAKEARLHLQKVRGWSDEECETHIREAFDLWSRRNEVEWHLDLSLITSNNLKLARSIPDKDERVGIMESKR